MILVIISLGCFNGDQAVMQSSGDWKCAQWAVLRAAPFLGLRVSHEEVERILPRADRGHSMAEIRSAMESIGVRAVGRRFTWDEFHASPFVPAIVHLKDPDHFVIAIRSTNGDQLWIDGEETTLYLKSEAARRRWSGNVLVLSRDHPSPPDLADERRAVAEFKSLHLDAGRVPFEQKQIDYSFELKNTGTAPLIIASVASDCGCFSVDAPSSPVQPGQEASIRCRYAANNQSRMIDHVATVTTNDPRQSKIVLRATGFYDRSVRVLPTVVQGGDVSHGQHIERKAYIHFPGETATVLDVSCDSELVVVSVDQQSAESEHPHLTTNMPSTQTASKAFVVNITIRNESIRPDAEIIRAEILVRTNQKYSSELRIPVVFRQMPPVQIQPDIVIFRRSRTAQPDIWESSAALIAKSPLSIECTEVRLGDSILNGVGGKISSVDRTTFPLQISNEVRDRSGASDLILRFEAAGKTPVTWESRRKVLFVDEEAGK
jgi:hypothetical protein